MEAEGGQPRTLREILSDFDARATPFDASDVSRPLWELKRVTEAAGYAMPADLHAEWLAFVVEPRPRGQDGEGGSKWGTYYGPIGGTPGPDGFVDLPSIDDVTPAMVTYWDGRARAARQPALRIRYADVAWDLGREQAVRVSPDMPRIVIDDTIVCADRRLFVDNLVKAFAALQRALGLALSLNDDPRAMAVAEAMIAYEDHVAQDRLVGTWGFVFDALVTNRPGRLTLATTATDKIVGDMEARLARLTGPSPEPKTLANVWGIERASSVLAQHYHRLEQPEDIRRVLRVYGKALLDITTRIDATVAMWWLERAFHIYRGFGMSRDAESTALRIRKLGPEAVKEMKARFHEVELPAEQVEQFLTAMTTGTLQTVLIRIALQFLPGKEQLRDGVKQMAQVAPMASTFGIRKMDATGRPVAMIGSVQDDLDGRVIEQATTAMWTDAQRLRWVMDRMMSVLKPTGANIREHVMQAPIFDRARGPVIERALTAYIDGDAVSAVHLLIPQIENAIRVMFETAGRLPFKWHRSGGWVLKILDDLLRENIVVGVLGESIVHYLRVLFTEQRGWNLRNDVCHGITPPEQFTMVMADRVFHALLLLALVRETSSATTAPPGTIAPGGGGAG